MNLTLLAPLGLAALVALVLPLLIHLVRRIELTTTEFAALRWIAERVRPKRRIRFERPWLLLLRLLLLTLLALLLARPVLTMPGSSAKPWVVVAAGVDRASARAAIADIDAQWHWLAPGFPPLESAEPPAPRSGAVPLASLLRELDAKLPQATAMHVVVPAELAGLDGERPRLAHAPDWHVLPGRMAVDAPSPPDMPIRLAVRHAPGQDASLGYLRAAVAAWNTREPGGYELDVRPLAEPVADDVRWLVVLGGPLPAPLSAWIERGGVAVLTNQAGSEGDPLWRDATGKSLARSKASGRGRVVALANALQPAELPGLLDADFPDRLLEALRGPPPAPTRAVASAMEPRHDPALSSSSAHSSRAPQALDRWLALAIALLFLLERIVAMRVPRGEPA